MSKDYFEHKETIGNFNKVIVTGPHGAGNKITAYIIDSDNEHLTHQRWEDLITSEETLREIILENKNNSYVTFCPSCSGLLHTVTDLLDDVLVIVTYKDIREIKSYRERNNIKDGIDSYETPIYEQLIDEVPELGYGIEDGLEEVTYGLWENYQRKLIPNWIETDHSSLSNHWKWVPRSERTNFKEWQTEIGEKP
jgi:hypothetical protein